MRATKNYEELDTLKKFSEDLHSEVDLDVVESFLGKELAIADL